MSGKPLDCVGIEPGGVGKADFQPSGPIVHAAVEPQGPAERYCSEKIAELVMTQQEMARVVAERDGLKAAMDFIARSDGSDLALGHRAIVSKARETLTKLASGELRKLSA